MILTGPIDAFVGMHEMDQFIWSANDGHLFNDTNAHVMAFNYHIYLNLLFNNVYGSNYKAMSIRELDEVLAKIDTTLKYNKIASKTESNGYKFIKKYYGAKYKEAKSNDKFYGKSTKTGIKAHEKMLDNLKKDLDDGDDDLEKINGKIRKFEKKAVKVNIESPVYQEYFDPIRNQLDSFNVLNESFKGKMALWKFAVDSTYLQSLINRLAENEFLLRQRSYFLEIKNYGLNDVVAEVDSIYAMNQDKILELYADSLSIEMLSGVETILKLQTRLSLEIQTEVTSLKAKDPEYKATEVNGYFNKILFDNYSSYLDAKERSLQHNAWMLEILEGFTSFWKEIEKMSLDQPDLNEERNEYILDLAEKENTRITKIYDEIDEDAKKWRDLVKKRIKEKEE